MVGGADDDGVDVLVFEQLSEVFVQLGFFASELLEVVGAALQHLVVYVGDGHALHARVF